MARKKPKRKQRQHRRNKQLALQGENKNPLSIADLVFKNINEMVEGETPKPAIPVAVRDVDDEERRAKKNQQYYLRRAKQENKPWFHCTRQTYKYSEDVLITPAMAAQLLDFNPLNRNMSDAVIDAYRRDVINKKWINSHESIGIDLQGNMFDGQHRIAAILEANKAEIVYVTFNCPVEARFVVDGGHKRTTAQKLKFITGRTRTKVPSVIRAMMRGVAPGTPRYTDSEIAEFLHKHEEVLTWVFENLKSNTRSDVLAVIGKAYLWFGVEKIAPFCERFKNLRFNADDDPAKTLYIWLMKHKGHAGGKTVPGTEVYKKALAAIQAEMDDRTISRLHSKDEDIFEWLPGWQTPE
jgi:hypothetical protein